MQTLTLDDLAAIRPYLAHHGSRLCDITIGAIGMWRDYFEMKWGIEQGALLLRYDRHNMVSYAPPLGLSLREGAELVVQKAREDGHAPLLAVIDNRQLAQLWQWYPGLVAECSRDWFDYLYRIEDLASMSGKRYHGQRNFINRFVKAHPDWAFRPMEQDDVPGVLAFLQRIHADGAGKGTVGQEEILRTVEVFDNYALYGMEGWLLEDEGRMIGVSVSEVVGDTLYCHIEKADREVTGAYPMLAWRTAEAFAGRVAYANREEDVGDLGLRRSKMGYHPIEISPKYLVRL